MKNEHFVFLEKGESVAQPPLTDAQEPCGLFVVTGIVVKVDSWTSPTPALIPPEADWWGLSLVISRRVVNVYHTKQSPTPHQCHSLIMKLNSELCELRLSVLRTEYALRDRRTRCSPVSPETAFLPLHTFTTQLFSKVGEEPEPA